MDGRCAIALVVSMVIVAGVPAFGYSWYEYGFDSALEGTLELFAVLVCGIVAAIMIITSALVIFSCVFVSIALLLGVRLPEETFAEIV